MIACLCQGLNFECGIDSDECSDSTGEIIAIGYDDDSIISDDD